MTTNEPEPLDVEPLVAQTKELGQSMAAIQDALGLATSMEERTSATEAQTRSNRFWISLTSVGLILDLILSVGFFIVSVRISDAQHTTKSVQCSLYGLVFSGGFHPERHTVDRTLYIHGYRQIVHDNNRLGCAAVKGP